MTKIFKNIIPGQRCLFYQKKIGDDNIILTFRAEFIDIINVTLRLTKVYCEERPEYKNSRLVTMPVEWIVKIETLEDIIQNNNIAPSEILLEIDKYL